MVKLEVEITDKMHEELEKECTKNLLPIDHVVRDILACRIRCKQKQEEGFNTFLGVTVEQWVQSLSVALQVLLQAKQQPPVGGHQEETPEAES